MKMNRKDKNVILMNMFLGNAIAAFATKIFNTWFIGFAFLTMAVIFYIAIRDIAPRRKRE